MNLFAFPDSPFQVQLCFDPIITNLEKKAAETTGEESRRALSLLDKLSAYPELRNGITDASQITQNIELISSLLADYFPAALTLNEIKAVNIPYSEIIFNHTQRFKNILNAAGPDFTINIRDFEEHQFYVISCCLILNQHYNTQLDFGKPLFFDIPTRDGIIKHYRILYNGDFLDILPTEKAIKLSQDDISLLLDKYNDLALWKEKFPKESWLLKGFAIMTLFDATVENAVSLFKEKLLGLSAVDFHVNIESIFQSIFQIPDLKVGFSLFKSDEYRFTRAAFGHPMFSFIVADGHSYTAEEELGSYTYHSLVHERVYVAASNTADFLAVHPESQLASRFLAQNIHSFILAPVVKNQVLLGVLEIGSPFPQKLNSVNANKLEVIMSFLTDTVERLIAQMENQIQAIIQDKFTAIHPSVNWKFRAEAQRLIEVSQSGAISAVSEIAFPAVYPLYGQIDVKGSSEARNESVQHDLQQQLKTLVTLLEGVIQQLPTESGYFREVQQQLSNFLIELSMGMKASTEQHITTYIERTIHDRLRKLASADLLPEIKAYFSETTKDKGAFHACRRRYETTISRINDTLADLLDNRQTEAQTIFPHYYERFKTDGVDHNLYVGQSIAPTRQFDEEKLNELRLWQLRVLCEQFIAHQQLVPSLPYPLEVTALLLVYPSTIGIRFRMDEKRFDVDGSYNVRFEIVKKRIDKALIKGTTERITQAGHLSIVYINDADELAYSTYLRQLQRQNLLEEEITNVEVEDLQGISGLKLLRAKLKYEGVMRLSVS
jgi:hypothetical protein